jgi:molecular chaperone DnaK (HSP70)
MGYKLALDFGTTNSLIALWDDEQPTAKIINLPNVSLNEAKDHPAIIPSLLYIQNGASGQVVVGQAVRAQGLDRQRDNRLFRNLVVVHS